MPDDGVVSVALRFRERSVSIRLTLATWVLAALLLAVVGSSPLASQVVRGIVRETESDRPLVGVLVSLEHAEPRSGDSALHSVGRARSPSADETSDRVPSARDARSVLSNDRGAYELRAARPGRFVVTAKRIGALRFVSSPFTLADGETTSLDITLERVRYELPPVAITAASPCASLPNEGTRVAALWDEVRTALSASQISVRDRLFRATVTRYARTLDPRTLRVTGEDRSSRAGVSERPFVSIDPDTLSRRGFAWMESDGSLVYHAPDATVLLSDAFLRDHCFALSTGRDSTDGMVGLTFEPVARRTTTDVRGTLWVDARSFELRFVAFRYDRLPVPADHPNAGGEVRFARLPSGAWVVSRWFIRMPQFATQRVAELQPMRAAAPAERYVVASYKEEGGDVRVAGAGVPTPFAILDGWVLDSTGIAPLRGGSARLAGTRYAAPVGADGRFTLDSLSEGKFTLVIEHEGYRALGVSAAEQDLSIERPGRSQTLLRALGTPQLMGVLCGTDSLGDDRAALRAHVSGNEADLTDSGGATSSVMGDTKGVLMVQVSWSEYSGTAAMPTREVRRSAEAVLDSRGAALFCDLPARTSLHIELLQDRRPTGTRQAVRLEPRTLNAFSVKR